MDKFIIRIAIRNVIFQVSKECFYRKIAEIESKVEKISTTFKNFAIFAA